MNRVVKKEGNQVLIWDCLSKEGDLLKGRNGIVLVTKSVSEIPEEYLHVSDISELQLQVNRYCKGTIVNGDVEIGEFLEPAEWPSGHYAVTPSGPWSISTINPPHLFVVGRTGSGKSHAIKKIIQNELNNYNVIIFDVHGEYDCDRNCINLSPPKIPLLDLPLASFHLLLGLPYNATTQIRYLRYSLKVAKALVERRNMSPLSALIAVLEYFVDGECKKTLDDVESLDCVIQELAFDVLGKGRTFRIKRLAENRDKESIYSLLNKLDQLDPEWVIANNTSLNGIVRLDFSAFRTVTMLDALVVVMIQYVLEHLLHQDSEKPTYIVIEEFHSLVDAAKDERGDSILRRTIVNMLRQGRKFKRYLIIISQEFDATVANNTTLMIGAIGNPRYLKEIAKVVPSLPDVELLTSLPVGTFIIGNTLVRFTP